MSASGKKLYDERAKGNGSYKPWDRLTKMAQEIWNGRAKVASASKKPAKKPKPKK